MIPTPLLIDACVMMDMLLPFRPRHTTAQQLAELVRTKDIHCCIPAHAYFEYFVTVITHFKKEPDKLDPDALTNSTTINFSLEIIPITQELVLQMLKADEGNAKPDLKSQDLIYYYIAQFGKLLLVTEDDKLRRIAVEGGVSAMNTEKAIDYYSKAS